MAFGTGTVWQIQSTATAANANGGGFNPGNANFPTDLTATSATGNSPVVASASYNFVAGDVGHWVYVKSGTNWTPGWYQIASVASNQATLSAAVGQAIQTSTTTGYPTPKYGTNTVAGCATTGSPTGGTWGLDYSQSDTAPFADTDLASATGTTNPSTVTSSNKPFGINHTGNALHVTAGTNWTQGWYEIVSVSGTTATLDRAVGLAASIGSGTFKVGGAISLGSSTSNQTDSNFFGGTHITTNGGNRFFIKGSATYTLGGSVTTAAGGSALPHVMEGYQTSRGDSPTGSNRPTLANGANSFTAAAKFNVYNIIATGTANFMFVGSGEQTISNSKFLLNGSTANLNNFLANGANVTILNCEFVNYRGRGLSITNTALVLGSWIHDSDVGIRDTAGTVTRSYIGNIIESNVTSAISFATAVTGTTLIGSNTLYGSENTTGTGIVANSGSDTQARVLNNIITGFSLGVNGSSGVTSFYDDYNDYYNNDTDVTNWQKGIHDLALNPTFTNVGQVTGTAGAFVAGNGKLVDTTKNFTTLGVVAGDCVYIVSGTGVTAGIYGISSISTTTNPNDTLNLDINPGTNTTADKVYQITTGHNFAIGTNLKAGGYPGVFPGAFTTGYLDIGAAQRQEGGGIVKMAGEGGGFVG